MNNQNNNQPLVIGRDIRWNDITGHVLRVIGFDRAGTTITSEGAVQAGSSGAYGHLLVESPVLDRPTVLPVCHRDDFLLAASFFDLTEGHLPPDAELLVTYVPKRKPFLGITGFSHVLHYVVVPPGTVERYYETSRGGSLRADPRVLFGEFVFSGAIRVKVNEAPDLKRIA